jgi:hypothetical protein
MCIAWAVLVIAVIILHEKIIMSVGTTWSVLDDSLFPTRCNLFGGNRQLRAGFFLQTIYADDGGE